MILFGAAIELGVPQLDPESNTPDVKGENVPLKSVLVVGSPPGYPGRLLTFVIVDFRSKPAFRRYVPPAAIVLPPMQRL